MFVQLESDPRVKYDINSAGVWGFAHTLNCGAFKCPHCVCFFCMIWRASNWKSNLGRRRGRSCTLWQFPQRFVFTVRVKGESYDTKWGKKTNKSVSLRCNFLCEVGSWELLCQAAAAARQTDTDSGWLTAANRGKRQLRRYSRWQA